MISIEKYINQLFSIWVSNLYVPFAIWSRVQYLSIIVWLIMISVLKAVFCFFSDSTFFFRHTILKTHAHSYMVTTLKLYRLNLLPPLSQTPRRNMKKTWIMKKINIIDSGPGLDAPVGRPTRIWMEIERDSVYTSRCSFFQVHKKEICPIHYSFTLRKYVFHFVNFLFFI